MEAAQPLFDRAYFVAALVVLGLGLWLSLSAPRWLGRLLGVVLTQAGALIMVLGAGAPGALIGVLIAVMTATVAIASALLLRLQNAPQPHDDGGEAP